MAVHELSGSSDPSSQEITALQNSYSGRQRPSSHWNVWRGQPKHKTRNKVKYYNFNYYPKISYSDCSEGVYEWQAARNKVLSLFYISCIHFRVIQ